MHASCHASRQAGHLAFTTTPPGGTPLVRHGAVGVTSVAELYQRQAALDTYSWFGWAEPSLAVEAV